MTTDTYTARISTTRELKALNSLAVTNNYSRAISDTGIKLLDPDGIHLVDFTMVHNDDHMRIGFLSKFTNVDEPIHLWGIHKHYRRRRRRRRLSPTTQDRE
jgi:hypothetical protein